MRIAFFGDGPWAHQALTRILATPAWTVVLVGARHQNPDPVLRGLARTHSIPFVAPASINAGPFLAELAALRPDVVVSMSYDQIIRSALIALPPLGMINVHAGALPFYRGRNVLNWAIINGEDSFGVTCHYVDEGIDTGDIIVQRLHPIGPDDDYGQVLEHAHRLCAEVLHEALTRIADGRVEARAQNEVHPIGFYCGRRRQGDESLDWGQSAKRVHNFVRGITLPGPGARTYAAGREIAILKSVRIAGAPAYIGTPGEVVGRNPDGIVVKCSDTTLQIVGVADVGTDGSLGPTKIPAFPIGTRLARRAGEQP